MGKQNKSLFSKSIHLSVVLYDDLIIVSQGKNDASDQIIIFKNELPLLIKWLTEIQEILKNERQKT